MNRQEEVQAKLDRVRTWLEGAGLEAVVLSSQANFAWLTGGGNNYVYVGDAAGEASLLVTQDQAYLLTNNIELRRLLEEEVCLILRDQEGSFTGSVAQVNIVIAPSGQPGEVGLRT